MRRTRMNDVVLVFPVDLVHEQLCGYFCCLARATCIEWSVPDGSKILRRSHIGLRLPILTPSAYPSLSSTLFDLAAVDLVIARCEPWPAHQRSSPYYISTTLCSARRSLSARTTSGITSSGGRRRCSATFRCVPSVTKLSGMELTFL